MCTGCLEAVLRLNRTLASQRNGHRDRPIYGSDTWTGIYPVMRMAGEALVRCISVVGEKPRIHAIGAAAQIGRQRIVNALWRVQPETVHDPDEVIAAGVSADARVMQFFLDYR